MAGYTGEGEITASGESDTSLKNFWWGGAIVVQQKCVRTVTRIPGVTKTRADSFHSSRTMSGVSGGSGVYSWVVYDAEGTDIVVDVAQIGNSNLYDVTETKCVYTASIARQNTRNLT